MSTVRVAGSSPWACAVYAPVYPNVTSKLAEPFTPVPVTSSGAANCAPRAAMGLRTANDPEVHVSEPNRHSPIGAVVFVIVTVNVRSAPGEMVNDDGDTVTS